MAQSREYAELRNDEKFVKCVENFDNSLEKIEASILTAVSLKDFEELSTQEKVKLDNYLAYSINSLYWMYVKLQGQDPNEIKPLISQNTKFRLKPLLFIATDMYIREHGIKNELSRVRQTILRDKQIYERNTIRPVLDKAAAGRFIKHGLHTRFDEDCNKIKNCDN